MTNDEALHDDQSSHYEISLTAGQAFMAFVLLLLSLAASFAFGLMIGRGQTDERLVVRKEPAIINEGSVIAAKKNEGKLVELGIGNDDFKLKTDTMIDPAALIETATASVAGVAAPTPTITEQPSNPAPQQPAYAQILSTVDQKTADTLAAKLIDNGFNTAYVERGTTDKGTAFRVRVKFATEAEARAAEAKLREFSKDVWIVK
ncbi:MAG: SPOR domain-containing protein [Acidobacteriota bacterium]